ncbi:MAG: hypothetical protein ACRDLD_02415 [Thermoleophilaceae bacterium]
MLRAAGYLVASRRHEGGAGDHLAIHPVHSPLLVETKGTGDLPWRSTFGPLARQALTQTADAFGAEPLMAWWPPGLKCGPIWLPAEDWPT